MDVMKKIGAYGLWVVLVLLGAWAFILARSTLLTILANYAGEAINRTYQARFLNPFLSVILGLILFIFILVSEDRIRQGIKKGIVLRNFSRLLGPLLLFLFILDLIIFIYEKFALVSWLRLLILLAELIVGLVCIYYGWSDRSPLLKKA
jgi:hypothetical protein